jgi:ribose transport system ATP-binding protein
MGENGAGKSTLMKILAGVYPKDSGEILYHGQPVAFASPREAQAMGVGIIHQELQLMNHLTVAQNMFIGREPRGLRPVPRRGQAQPPGGASFLAA